MDIKKGNKILAAIIIIMAVLILLYIGNNSIETTRYTLQSEKIPVSFNGFKILQLSDLHSKNFGNKNDYLLKKIEEQNPDIIVLTGDMVDSSDKSFDVFFDLAQKLVKKYKVYYIVGNHEQDLKGDNLNQIEVYIKSVGIKVLDNEKVEIEKGNETINLYGLWINLRYYRNLNSDYSKDQYFGITQIKSILGDTDKSKFNILLMHNPMYFDTYSDWGADLTLCGHIHGGMIRLPFLGGLLSPEREFFPKYSAGEFDMNGNKMIVNRGLGNGSFPIRILNNPEISVIILQNK